MSAAVAALIVMSSLSPSTQQSAPIRLWEGDAPLAHGKAAEDIPTLTPFLAPRPIGSAVIICPGGGYGMLADHEGSAYAKFLNLHGVQAFVLKYRLGSNGYRHPAMLLDVSRAIRYVRSHVKEYQIDSLKIGVMGSSAGGHLASTVATHYDAGKPDSADPIERVSSRPDFTILCYAVITFGGKGHSGSRENLLGKNPDPALVQNLSNELQVTKDTPPCFLWHTMDDGAVPVENSILFADAMRKVGASAELHLYPHGAHGLGLGGDPESNHLLPWTRALVDWMRANGWA